MVRYRVRIRCLLVVVVLYKYWGKLIIRFMTRVELGLPWMWGGDSVGGVRYEGWLEWRAKKSTMKGFSSHCGTRTVLERYTVCFFFYTISFLSCLIQDTTIYLAGVKGCRLF